MSEKIVTFPTIRGEDGHDGIKLMTVVTLRLPQVVGSRLRAIASDWNMEVNEAAVDLLTTAVNQARGLRR